MKRKADASKIALEAGEDEVLCCGCGGYVVVVGYLSCACDCLMLVFVLSCVWLVSWLYCLALSSDVLSCASGCLVVVLFCLCCVVLPCVVLCCLVLSCNVFYCLCLVLSCL